MNFNDADPNVLVFNFKMPVNQQTVFNIGGSQIFALGMNHPNFKFAHITEIDDTFNCDTFLPILPLGFTKTEIHNPVNENELTYTFTKYERH